MLPLGEDLQKVKKNIDEFGEIAIRVLQYLPNVLSSTIKKNNYSIHTSKIDATTKFIRPINHDLFIYNDQEFILSFNQLKTTLYRVKLGQVIEEHEKKCIDRTVYTIQQSIGAGLDLFVNQNSARKHVGNRFEELIKVIFTEIGVSNKKLVLQIPYETEEGSKTYKCENDLIISPFLKVRSSVNSLDDKEVVVSIKTTSKDRMGKMFIDKILLERFVGHPQKVIGIFLNDVQRKENDNISFTLVSGLFEISHQTGRYILLRPATQCDKKTIFGLHE